MDGIIELFHKGLSIHEIARRTGKNYSVVRFFLIRRGLHQVRYKRVKNDFARCKRCDNVFPQSDFPALAMGKYLCQNCLSAANNLAQLRRRGSTLSEYERLLAEQEGRCAICGAEEGHRSKNGTKCRLAVDHDHATGIVRGLLCGNCNRGLGRFKDSIDLLEAALRYLKREQ